MTDQPFDSVAVALLGDLSDLMEKMEQAAQEAERAGEAAGEAFNQAMTESLGRAGDVVRQMAEQMGVSFQEAAARLQGEGFFEVFDEDQLVRAAEALDQFKMPLVDMIEPLRENVELQGELAAILGDQTAPGLVETQKLIDEVRTIYEEYGVILREEVIAGIQEMNEINQKAIEAGQEIMFTQEEIIQGALEGAQAQSMAEQAVRKVVEAYREMGIVIPDALQRDRIRRHVKDLETHADGVQDVRIEVDQFVQSMIQKGEAMKGTESILGRVTNVLGQFGINLGGLLPQLAAGTAALGVLKIAFDEIRQATAFAMQMTDTTEELAAAFRINQLAGEENTMTFKEWRDTATEVMEITGQPMQTSVQGVTQVLRELGASTELTDTQINDLILTGAVFTKQYGGTLPQSVSQLSDFINTGLSASLQRLGLDIDKAAQNAKAFELGLGTNIDKLSEADQRLVRYTLLMEELAEKTAATDDDLVSFADRIDDINTRTQTAQETLGNLFVPISIKLKEFQTNIREGFTGLVGIIVVAIQTLIADVVGRILALGATVKFVLDNIKEDGIDVLLELEDVFNQAFEQARFELLQYQVQQATGGMDEYAQSAEGAADATNELGDAVVATAEQIEGFIEAARKFDEGMKKIEQTFLDRMANITREFTQRRSDLETDFLRDMRDVDADAAVDRLQTIREYQVDEIRLREDHQLDIRQLEERFILDLEDAVRERDARGVLNLQRRFNLEKKQREEDFNLKNKRLKEDFRMEMQEIEFQRQLRRRERHVAYQEELMDLALQEERKREMARLQRARAERDLLESIKNRLLALEEQATGELAIQQELLDNLVAALTATYGPDGPWVLWHQEAVKTTQLAGSAIHDAQGQIIDSLWRTEGAIRAHVQYQQRAAQQIAAAWQSTRFQMQQRVGTGVQQFQRGGEFVATSPRMISVGEGRPERVSIAPLSAATGQPSAGFRRDGGGERVGIDLNVDASEMLVVEVADQTMTEIADIMVNVNSKNYQGGRGA